jgi:predicted nucleic acid-binding protein
LSLYIDTSCLLKLIVLEPESAAVAAAVERETDIVVSSLALAEIEVRLQRLRVTGTLTPRNLLRLSAKRDALVSAPPFRPTSLGAELFVTASAQAQKSSTYCRTLDRLHLAAMELLSLRRLLTNDGPQARAAAELGFEVLTAQAVSG